jgi:hypothetical protein
MTNKLRDEAERIARGLVSHFFFDEDHYYSCGMVPECANDINKGKCTCGYDYDVKKITEALLAFKGEDNAGGWKAEALELRGKVYELELALQGRTVSCSQCNDAGRRIVELEDAIQASLNELGVPTPDYPAPVYNTVTFLSKAISKSRQGEV